MYHVLCVLSVLDYANLCIVTVFDCALSNKVFEFEYLSAKLMVLMSDCMVVGFTGYWHLLASFD